MTTFQNIQASDYQERTLVILKAMLVSEPGLRVSVPIRTQGIEWYESILIVSEPPKVSVSYFLEQTFGVTVFKLNSGQYSFSLEGTAIDWIVSEPQLVEYARAHNSYDGLGPLIGRLAFCMGLKSNNHGLQYCIREPLFDGNIVGGLGHVLDTVPVSNSYVDLINLLGLPVDKFFHGFSSREDAFNWLKTSPRFNRSLFDKFTSVMGAQTESRNLATYHEFDKWVANTRLPENPLKRKMQYLRQDILPRFPHVEPRVYASNARFLRKREVNRRINSDKARAWLALDKSVDIKEEINRFKDGMKEIEIMSMSDDEVKQAFLAYYYREE